MGGAVTRAARHALADKLIKRAERWYAIADRRAEVLGYSLANRAECGLGRDEQHDRLDVACERAYRVARRLMTAGFNAA